MAKKPPKITVTVPASTGTGKGSKYDQFINHWAAKFPALKQNAADIEAAAKEAKIDPVWFASLILLESRGKYNSPPSSAGAIGVGQLEPSSFVGQTIPWGNRKITMKDLEDPTTNLRLSAYYAAKLVGKYGYANAYSVGYNPGYSGEVGIDPKAEGPSAVYGAWSKQYIPTTTSVTPPSGAGQQAPGGTAPPASDIPFKDPYIAGVVKGNKFSTTLDPNKALQYDGAPLTRSGFLSLRDSLSSHYVSYTGKRPTNSQISNFLKNGWTTYTLDVLLSKSASFKNSPIYKQYANNFQAAVKDILPANGKIPDELMRQAVINQWDATTVAAKLRQTPGYLGSNEFTGNVASMLNIHNSIMGTPTTQDMVGIKDAAAAGWTADQYAAWLRSQPSYSSSPEYQTKAMGFLNSLGLITGAQTILAPGVGPGPGAIQPSAGSLPASKLIPGKPTEEDTGLNLGATLSRA